MDLSSLFGPPVVFITSEQADAIREYFAGEGTVGHVVQNDGAGTVTAFALKATVEGGRAIPTESEPVFDTGILVTSTGEVFPFDGNDGESFGTAMDAATEASQELLDAIESAQRDAVEELV